MDINNLIVKMAHEASSEDTYHNQANITISVTALRKFAKLFALHAIHDSTVQQELFKEETI